MPYPAPLEALIEQLRSSAWVGILLSVWLFSF